VEELSQFYSKLGLRQAIDDDDLKVFILGVNELEIHRDQAASQEAVTIRVQVDEIDRVQSSLRQQAIEFQQADQDARAVCCTKRATTSSPSAAPTLPLQFPRDDNVDALGRSAHSKSTRQRTMERALRYSNAARLHPAP
jgi:hypothetical protein